MAERKPSSWDEIRGIIDRVDEACRESERTRREVERSMKQRPSWPERPSRRTDEAGSGAMDDSSPEL